MKIVYVLKRETSWHEIKEEELKEWLKDGSIQEGDLIVYPKKVLIATEVKEIKLEEG